MKPASLLALVAALALAATAQANIIPNPDFGEVVNGSVAGWKVAEFSPPADIPATGSVVSKRNVDISLQRTPEDGHFLRLKSDGHTAGDSATVASPAVRVLPGFSYNLSFRYRAKGLQAENANRSKVAAVVLDFLFRGPAKGSSNVRILTSNNTEGWTTLKTTFTAPDGTINGGIHLTVRNNYDNNPVVVDVGNVALEANDPTVPNAGFENGAQGRLTGWKAIGGAQSQWVQNLAHDGKACVSVGDAPNGNISGWATEVPVRPDRLYSLDGWIKTGDLSAQGFVGGAVLQMQFLDNDGQPLGNPVQSPAVSAHADWTHVTTPPTQAPPGTVTVQLTCGMSFTNGTAWFDDLNLGAEPVAAAQVARLQRTPAPDPTVHYATNLLANGDIENGADGKPAGWTYIGKADMDWTPDEIARFYAHGRPDFNMGRGQGVWSHDMTYAGKGALLNISIDPPLSKNRQWYGRTPVDGAWLSDPMPCEPGKTYTAGGWIRPGVIIDHAWYGPLQLRFYGVDGREIRLDPEVRCSLDGIPAGSWSYFATLPSQAPAGATTMRLRFGQELSAQTGGWGRSYADNLAVWELPADVPLPEYRTTTGSSAASEDWFAGATASLKPPYLPSPENAPAYDSVWGRMENTAVGNLFYDPNAPVKGKIDLENLLGETRDLSLQIVRYDWLGHASDPVTIDHLALAGSGETTASVDFPPTKSYGAFDVEIEVREGAAVVGHLSGRYAVLPKLDRPRTAENIWGVTPLTTLTGEDTPFNHELGTMLKTAGFGTAWVRMMYPINNPAGLSTSITDTSRVIDWYHQFGLQCIVQLHPQIDRGQPYDAYGKAAGTIAQELKGKVRAFGNWGIEMANSLSPFRGGGAERYGDDVYDSIVGAQYDGIKAVTPDVPVYTGNIATDMEGKTLHRLYGPPCNGRFDGVVINTYLGIGSVIQSAVREFDSHGDTKKDVWMEESPYQASPHEGDARRYGEATGPMNMVRTWLGNYGANYPRLRLVTMWGFNNKSDEDINMVSTRLQPRPLYAAFAVMSNALADAQFVANRSSGDISGFEWKRGDGPFFVFWTEAGDRTLTLQVPAGQLTLMDLMGNEQTLTATKGLVTLTLTRTPVYVFDGGAVAVAPAVAAANPPPVKP